MPHNRIAPALLSAVLAVSVMPTGALAASDHSAQATDPAVSLTSGEGANELEALEGVEAAPENEENVGEAANENTGATESPEEIVEAPVTEESSEEPGALADTDTTTDNDTTDAADPATDPAEDAGIAIVRGGARTAYSSLADAVADAQDGDVIELSRDQVLDEQLVIAGGRDITLRATAQVTLTRSSSFPMADNKIAGMLLVNDGAKLTLERADDASSLTLDGEEKDSNEAIITLRNASKLTMNEGASIVRAHCSWKPWGAVYVHSGTFVLDGGEIRDSFAMRNTAVAVEAAGSFEMRGGTIANNRASYTQTMVWTKGSITMTGGTIANNRSNVSSDGVVQVLSGGSLAFEGGTIGDNNPNNTFGVRVDGGGSLALGAGAHLAGADRIDLAQGATLRFTGTPAAHSIDEPIEIVLSGEWADGTLLAATNAPETARDVLGILSVKHGGAREQLATAGIDPSNECNIALASADVVAAFDALDNPFVDDLGLELRDELTAEGSFDRLRDTVNAHFSDADTPERRVRAQQIERLEQYAAYLSAHHEELEASVLTLSELGNPGSEAQRTQQGYQFDNLDATGLYLKPGKVHEIVVYVDADDPSVLSVAWRQAGLTDTNSYTSLNLEQKSKLARGENRITIDLSGKTHGSMLFLRNDSTSNPARVRIESYDAPYVTADAEDGADADGSTARDGSAAANPALGTSLGEHPLYEHDPEQPERFWAFVQDVKAHAARVEAGEQVADMALVQMGDDGHAQFSITATALAQAYAGITSKDAAVSYIERSNEAIQDRLEFFWAFDGFDATDSGANAISPARVHTAFTRTVTYPSTLYAYVRYFHMPESEAAQFLSGENVYTWGMSHEYGHMLDNNIIAVGEETNNLYSLAGSRQGGIEASAAAGIAFDPAAYYHGNAVKANERRDEELAKMAADPTFVPDWMNGGDWGTYIWTHVTTWWNGLHFFDDWDYSGYDYAASPYTQEIAADVARYGAYGATVRILRSDAEAVKTIQELASGASSSTSVKYNRIAVAFTMGTGYNFAEYLYDLGERDLTPEVLEWCAQYPSVPRAVRYFSLDTDAAIINGAKTYAQLKGSADAVSPVVSVELGDAGTVRVEATMATSELEQATTAYELYRDGTLIGFSRDGSFEVAVDAGANAASADGTADGAFDKTAYSVVAYDVRVNPSRAANVDGPISDAELPDTDEPGDDGELPGGDGDGSIDGDTGNGGGSIDGDNGNGDGSIDGDTGAGGGDDTDSDTSTDGDNGTGGDDDTGGDGSTDGDTGSDNETGSDNDGTTGGGSNQPGGDSPTDGGASGNGNPNDSASDTDADEDAAGQAQDANPLAADASGRLSQTGDASALPIGIAAAGSAIAFIGAAIARRFRKS